jgi:hypothetical protein
VPGRWLERIRIVEIEPSFADPTFGMPPSVVFLSRTTSNGERPMKMDASGHHRVCHPPVPSISMNSYPIELLVQHAPLMFVAGLELPKGKQDPFHALITRLREVLGARPKGLVWDKHRSSAFNILLVDKVSNEIIHANAFSLIRTGH